MNKKENNTFQKASSTKIDNVADLIKTSENLKKEISNKQENNVLEEENNQNHEENIIEDKINKEKEGKEEILSLYNKTNEKNMNIEYVNYVIKINYNLSPDNIIELLLYIYRSKIDIAKICFLKFTKNTLIYLLFDENITNSAIISEALNLITQLPFLKKIRKTCYKETRNRYLFMIPKKINLYEVTKIYELIQNIIFDIKEIKEEISSIINSKDVSFPVASKENLDAKLLIMEAINN